MKSFILHSFFSLLLLTGCTAPKPFVTEQFLERSVQYHLLSPDEASVVSIQASGLPEPDIRAVSFLCRKINLETIIKEHNLDPVNPDSNFSYIRYIREQLFQRSRLNPKGPVYLEDNQADKEQYTAFIKSLNQMNFLTPSQYARTLEKLRTEPVVFPFMVYEWIETIP